MGQMFLLVWSVLGGVCMAMDERVVDEIALLQFGKSENPKLPKDWKKERNKRQETKLKEQQDIYTTVAREENFEKDKKRGRKMEMTRPATEEEIKKAAKEKKMNFKLEWGFFRHQWFFINDKIEKIEAIPTDENEKKKYEEMMQEKEDEFEKKVTEEEMRTACAYFVMYTKK